MGGINSGVIFEQRVKRGDLCNVQVWSADSSRFVLTTFLEFDDNGSAWFQCERNEDSVMGFSCFSSIFPVVGDIIVIGEESVEMFTAEGI